EGIGITVAAVLTLAVLSAAFGSNRVSRLAFAVLVGAAVGYASTVTWWLVLWPRVIRLVRDPLREWPLILWFALGLLLLVRGLGAASGVSSVPLAFLVGVGVALAAAGAALGTGLPLAVTPWPGYGADVQQPWARALNTLLVAVGTAGVLLRFAYTVRRSESRPGRLWRALARGWGRIGYIFILVAFGALFAAAIISLVGVLVSRLEFLLIDWLLVVRG
ncbi:MAG: hypothetical protein K6V36_06465, partial [Anaerolineae bacterium]|nr:hypothetical protein [Anaerolineae bacterium]